MQPIDLHNAVILDTETTGLSMRDIYSEGFFWVDGLYRFMSCSGVERQANYYPNNISIPYKVSFLQRP